MTRPPKRTVSYIVKLTGDESAGHHSLGVNALAYCPTTRKLVSAGRDGVVSVWAPESATTNASIVKTGTEIKQSVLDDLDDESEIVKLEAAIQDQPFAPIAVTANDYKLDVTGHQHLDWINDVKVIDESQLTVATCSNDLSVKLWTATTNCSTTVGWHDDYVKAIGYCKRHSDTLVSGGLDRTLKLWDLEKTQEVDKFTFGNENSSIYSLDCYGDLVLCGGPNCNVALFDRRTMNRPIKNFLGHTDTVRCLKLGSNTFLSGSSDTTVRLWDLRTNRVMRYFDMHNTPVWSLATPEGSDSFDVFYSGDKSGVVLKTDLRASNLEPDRKCDYFNDKVNESLGVSTVVADIGTGVLDITEGSGLLWTATAEAKDQFMTSWRVPDTENLVAYQGIKLYRNLRLIEATQGQQSIASDDLVSQLSRDDMDQIDQALTSQATMSNGEEEFCETFFVSLEGGPDSEYVVGPGQLEDGNDEAAPDSDLPVTLEISYEKVPDELVTVVPYNGQYVQAIAGSNGLIKARMLNNRRDVATMDQNGSIHIVDVISCKLVKTIPQQGPVVDDCEAMADRFEEMSNNLQTNETLPSWCTVQTKGGMLFVNLQESTFTGTEIYCDDFHKEYGKEYDGKDVWYNIGKIVLKSLFYTFSKKVFESEFVQERVQNKVPMPDLEAIASQSTQNGGEVHRGTGSVGDSSKSSSSSSDKKEKKGSKFFRLGRHHHDKDQGSQGGSSAKSGGSSASQRAVSVGRSGHAASTANGKSSSSFSGKQPKDSEAIRTEAISHLGTSRELLQWADSEGITKPQHQSAIPSFNYDREILLTINENIRQYGNDTKTLYLTTMGKQKQSETILEFEDLLPDWVTRAVCLGRYPHKDTPKVSFELKADPKSNVPQMDSPKLSGYSMLRVSKVIDFAKDKLPAAYRDTPMGLKCRDQVLDSHMTLSTIKARIWKSSSDVELVYFTK